MGASPPFLANWVCRAEALRPSFPKNNITLTSAASTRATTWTAFLDELPMAVVTHIAAASHRANGGRTARPYDYGKALETLKEMSPPVKECLEEATAISDRNIAEGINQYENRGKA